MAQLIYKRGVNRGSADYRYDMIDSDYGRRLNGLFAHRGLTELIPTNLQTAIDSDVLEAVFTNMNEGVLVINHLRKIVTMNTAASQITGWKQRDLTSINCNVFSCRNEHGKKACAETCLAQRCIETGQSNGPMYLRLTRASGTTVSVEATYIPVRATDPRSGVTVLLVKDITVLEYFDSTVRQLNEEIAEKNIVLRGFSEQMSVAWRAAMIDLRAGSESLRARHAEGTGRCWHTHTRSAGSCYPDARRNFCQS